MTQEKKILDPHGNPLLSCITWRQRWNAISTRVRITLVSILAVIAAAAALLTNLDTIQKHLTAAPRVPPIVVEITNSSKNAISVVTRGDFFLWLPGPGGKHATGKYEFHTMKDARFESLVFTVGPAGKMRLLAYVLNQDLYGMVLKKADCDIAFMVRKANGGHNTTDNLPFTKEAINKYYATVDIGAD